VRHRRHHPDNAAPLLQAGADMLAVITSLYEAADPRLVAERFITLFEEKTP